MSRVRQAPLPKIALLLRYGAGVNYTDCFVLDVDLPVTLSRFVQAFYTTPLFRMERLILAAAGRPSTDAGPQALAEGKTESFAAWQVEARGPDQVLLQDMTGRTRSWFMVSARDDGRSGTCLSFGSAIVAVPGRAGQAATIGPVFRALTGVHIVYSRALLSAAASRLARQTPGRATTDFAS